MFDLESTVITGTVNFSDLISYPKQQITDRNTCGIIACHFKCAFQSGRHHYVQNSRFFNNCPLWVLPIFFNQCSQCIDRKCSSQRWSEFNFKLELCRSRSTFFTRIRNNAFGSIIALQQFCQFQSAKCCITVKNLNSIGSIDCLFSMVIRIL